MLDFGEGVDNAVIVVESAEEEEPLRRVAETKAVSRDQFALAALHFSPSEFLEVEDPNIIKNCRLSLQVETLPAVDQQKMLGQPRHSVRTPFSRLGPLHPDLPEEQLQTHLINQHLVHLIEHHRVIQRRPFSSKQQQTTSACRVSNFDSRR